MKYSCTQESRMYLGDCSEHCDDPVYNFVKFNGCVKVLCDNHFSLRFADRVISEDEYLTYLVIES